MTDSDSPAAWRSVQSQAQPLSRSEGWLRCFLFAALFFIIIGRSYAQTSIGLQGYWPLDEGSGTATADASGNTSTGTITGPVTWAAGRVGTAALSFNGTDGVVNAGAKPALANLPAITISAWIRPAGTGETGFGRIAQKGNGTLSAIGFWFNLTSNGGLQFSSFFNSGSVQRIALGSSIGLTGVWQHVVATWDGTSAGAGIHLYRNSVELGYSSTVNGSGSRVDDSASVLWIGNNDLGNRTFNGLLDDIRIYNRVLTVQEITDLFNSAPAPPSDTTAPAVTLTAPLNGATVSGNVTVSANASDNIAVTGVQFKIDGNNLGPEVTIAPYSLSWNSATAPNGSHTLTAVARDAAGNSTTSSGVTVTVDNVVGDPSSNLRAYWTLDEGSGTTVVDSSGNGSTGTVTGPVTWAAGRVGPFALSFNGTDGAVNTGVNPVLANLPAMTLSAWILPYGSGEAGWGRIIQKGTASGTVHPPGYWFNMTPDRGLEFSVMYATTNLNKATTGAITLGGWQHVVATWDGSTSAGSIHMYRNGVELPYVRTIDAVGARGNDSTGNVWLGNASLMSRTFNGVIDDARIYDRVLTPAEVTSLYTSSPPPPSDTTPPTVSLSAPTNGATVSATITVSANAGDNIAVAGVQFKLDGNNLGAEVTASPYSLCWNTASTLDGTHVLTAVARDAAGNTTTSDPVTVTVSNPVVDPSISLRGYWPMDEGSGTTTADASGYTSTGTITGSVTWAAGRVGTGALSFNGTDGVVNAGAKPALANLPAITISAWIRPAGTGETGFGRIVQKGNGTLSAIGFWFNLTGNGGLQFSSFFNSGSVQRIALGSSIGLTGVWQHVVATWDGTSAGAGIHLYRNGVELGYSSTVNGSGSRVDDSASVLWIGNNDLGNRTFNGLLDDVHIYNRVLTQQEITDLYNSAP